MTDIDKTTLQYCIVAIKKELESTGDSLGDIICESRCQANKGCIILLETIEKILDREEFNKLMRHLENND